MGCVGSSPEFNFLCFACRSVFVLLSTLISSVVFFICYSKGNIKGDGRAGSCLCSRLMSQCTFPYGTRCSVSCQYSRQFLLRCNRTTNVYDMLSSGSPTKEGTDGTVKSSLRGSGLYSFELEPIGRKTSNKIILT